MSYSRRIARRRRRAAPLIALALGNVVVLPALAEPPRPANPKIQLAQAPEGGSTNATINLINLMVKRGLLDRGEADELIRQANAEAAAAQRRATAPPVAAGGSVSGPAPATGGQMRVTYVPDVVRKQIKDEVKQEVMAQAKAENWAAPNVFPEWASRVRFTGEVRTRYEGQFYPRGNDLTGGLVNFNSINTGSPYDVSNANIRFPPLVNANADRDRFRIRARLGVDADLGEGFSTGLHIGTGDSNSPVSPNQSLGFAGTGQGGNFSKYAVWLERAYIKYEPWKEPGKSVALTVGRFDNPFFAPSQLMWDDDLGFDGVAVQAKYEVSPGITPFINIGAFPVFNTDLNFSSAQPEKYKSYDKYLYGAQIGVDWKIRPDTTAKLGVGYYYFTNIEGKLSSPCIVGNASDNCDTDHRRPSFAQRGNTYMALRNIVPTAENGFGTTNQFQYFGLASRFRELSIAGKVDYDGFAPVRVSLYGEFVKNLAFDRKRLKQNAVNNRGPGDPGKYEGGDTGYFIGLTVGSPQFKERWDWAVDVGYKYVESDATVDAFSDSDFGLGGTNLKGFLVGGRVALSRHVWAGARWMSADSIAGPPFSVDIVQVNLGARF